MASAGIVSMLADDLVTAASDLAIAYPTALGTKDFPIIAIVGVATAALALATGHPHESAVVLGAAARLRGSPDHTDVGVVKVTADLRVDLGDVAFERAFADGLALSRDEALAKLDPGPFSPPTT